MPQKAIVAVALILAAALAAGAAGPPASTPESAGDDRAVIAGLQRWLDGTRDLECRFDQRLVSGALGAGAHESGVMYLSRPGRMRWDYLRPERKTVIVEGTTTLLYVAEDRQLIRGRLAPEQDLLPGLLAGKERIADLFRANVTPGPGGRHSFRVRLVPRSESEAGVAEVTVSVRAPEYAIEEADVLDPAGNRMDYRFTSIRRNAALSETIFTFEPPPGTEIVVQP